MVGVWEHLWSANGASFMYTIEPFNDREWDPPPARVSVVCAYCELCVSM